MEENSLKGTMFSIIKKEKGIKVEFQGSIIGIASIIADVATKNDNVKNIIMLAVIALKAEETGELDECFKHNANN